MNNNEYIINIEGVIGYPDPITKMLNKKTFSYGDVLLHIKKIKKDSNIDTIILAINSPGGYINIGEKIYDELDKLKTEGYTFLSYNTGDVASMATKIFLLSDPENRIFYEEKGSFLIHNPWGNAQGDSEELLKASEKLKQLENEFAVFYTVKTEMDIETAQKFMKEDEPLTSDMLEEFGIAKVIKKQKVKAVALLNQKINLENMNNENVVKEKVSMLDSVIKNIKKTFNMLNMILTDDSANELEFPDVNDENEIVEGTKVNLNGAPAPDGDYTITSINKIVSVEGGLVLKISEIESTETTTTTQENGEEQMSIKPRMEFERNWPSDFFIEPVVGSSVIATFSMKDGSIIEVKIGEVLSVKTLDSTSTETTTPETTEPNMLKNDELLLEIENLKKEKESKELEIKNLMDEKTNLINEFKNVENELVVIKNLASNETINTTTTPETTTENKTQSRISWKK